MNAILALVALFFASVLAQSNFTINTPSQVTECEPTLLTWSGGSQPYSLSILPGTTPTGTPLESYDNINGTSYTWVCNIMGNTYIGFTLRDSTGRLAQSAPLTIQIGSSSCINSSSPTGSGSPSSASSTSGSSGTTASSGATTASSSASSPSSSSSSSSNGASTNIPQFGGAAVVGAAVVALLF